MYSLRDDHAADIARPYLRTKLKPKIYTKLLGSQTIASASISPECLDLVNDCQLAVCSFCFSVIIN